MPEPIVNYTKMPWWMADTSISKTDPRGSKQVDVKITTMPDGSTEIRTWDGAAGDWSAQPTATTPATVKPPSEGPLPSQTTRVKGSNGNWWNYNEVTNTSVDTGIPYDTRSPEEIAAELEYKKALTASAQHSAGGPYATPDKQGELESRLLDIEKKRQALMAPALLAFQQWQDVIDQVEKNPNQFNIGEAQKLVDLARQNYYAVLQGTTPWTISQAEEKRKADEQARKDKQRENQLGFAQNTINSRMSTGGNLAQGLFSGLTGAFGNILSSTNPRYNYNPFDMANSYMNQQQGGSEMSDLALALLRGALKGEQQ